MKDSGDDISAVLGLDKSEETGLTARLLAGKFRWPLIAGGLIVIAFVASRMFSSGPPVEYQTANIAKGGLVASVTATGTLQPLNTVDIGPEISGQIVKVLVDFNDRVTAGQVLAVMDTENLHARVLQSRASLAAAKAKVEDSRATAAETKLRLARLKDLQARGNASKQDLDTAEAADARARAGVTNAQAQVDVAQANANADATTLAKTEIKAPISGIVLSRSVDPGQVVAATFQTPVLFKLAEDLRQMELLVDVDEADIGFVQEGQTATFTVDAFQDRQFPAVISQVRFAPRTVDNVVTYQAVLTVANEDLSLRPGMTATSTITTATRQNAVLLPNAALRFQPPPTETAADGRGAPPGLFKMFVPKGMGQPGATSAKTPGASQRVWTLDGRELKAIDIKVGLSDGQRTEIVEGPLKPGDRVVIGLPKPKR